MKIKSFVFPSFEEWVEKSKEVKIKIGAYCCEVRAFSWTSGTCKVTYMFALSLSNVNPLNIYTNKLFCRTFEYDGNSKNLEQWYYNTINDFNTFWEEHVKSTYLENK